MLGSHLWRKLFAGCTGLVLIAVALGQTFHPVLAAALTLTLAAVAVHLHVRSIRELAAGAEARAAGDRGRRLIVADRRDELGRMARAFDDLSARLHHELDDLALEHDRLMAILRSMGEGVVAIDGDQRLVHINRVAGRLLEVVPEKALGRPIWEVTRIREVPETLEATLTSGLPSQRVAYLPGRTDQVVELRATPLRGGGDGLEGAVLVLDDVTRLRKLETVRQDFVGNVSHELKTPVTAIRGLVETLLEDEAMPPAVARDFLGKIRNQTERLSVLVTDLLSLSRLEASAGSLQVAPLDARQTVLDSVHALAPSSEAKGVEVVTELPDEPATVLGEHETLAEAVRNLLDNAIKYSPEKGRVDLRVRLAGGDGRESVVIEVEDRGPGIAPRHQERIFERFYRIDKARSRALGGTGLGLAIVKHVARALGGDVAVESRLGEGSIFRIRLPRHHDS